MKFTADFHIHSHYSIATSKTLVPEYINYWAGVKGIKVVGTGDFTHPGWLEELEEKLKPAEPGLFRLKEEHRLVPIPGLPEQKDGGIRFILTSEISNIYKKGDKVRKIHNLVFAPDFETVRLIQRELSKIGNITSDGRPILGLDSKELLEIALSASENTFFVPSHIWTPWFSVLGSKSGFDSIEGCYGDLASYINAVETGLSSDPPMNWLCSFLDRYTLISNSDAHSPEKLGREANLFNTELSYDSIIKAMKTGESDKFLGTIEFFPQEGKYHNDGHRKCGVNWTPLETLKHDGICPVCGKKVTIGVMNRVAQLMDRDNPQDKINPRPFHSLIPLKELLSEITGSGAGTKRVTAAYNTIIQKIGSELEVLMSVSEDVIKTASNELLAEAVMRMRKGEVLIKEGFDGEYGKIKVFDENERRNFGRSDLLFTESSFGKNRVFSAAGARHFDQKAYKRYKEMREENPEAGADRTTGLSNATNTSLLMEGLNQEQTKAVSHGRGPALVLAGPGTGKTKVLTSRIADLILNRDVPPENILAVTFTNRAAKEMAQRLKPVRRADSVTVCTFHALGLSILTENRERVGRSEDFSILDEEDKLLVLRKKVGCEKSTAGAVSESLSAIKRSLLQDDGLESVEHYKIFRMYEEILTKLNAFDLDDLIYRPVQLLNLYPDILSRYRETFRWIMVDEYQDINYAQYNLIKLLASGTDPNLYVIGDPDQAIYGFRGSDVMFINKFIDDFPGAAMYGLKRSYRCTNYILRASRNIIKDSEPDKDRPVLEGLQEGLKIQIVESPTGKSEAEFIARTVEKMMGGLRFFSIDSDISGGSEESEISSLSDFAVLCRVKEQMKAIEEAFNNHVIPHQKAANDSILKQEPVRSVVDILKFLKNPENRYIREKLSAKGIAVNGGFKTRVSMPVHRIIGEVLSRFFPDRKKEHEYVFKQLGGLAERFGDSLDDFIKFIDLGTDTDIFEREVEKVSLMTLHAAKGLEFKCVFIPGCENNLIPFTLFGGRGSDAGSEPLADYAEEKRLLYVGMTRAKKFLYLSSAQKRYIFRREYHFEKSPFLESIENELTERLKKGKNMSPRKKDIQMDLF
jgi:DNA helicase-2/ATP-dependent DNA helicase PcrA